MTQNDVVKIRKMVEADLPQVNEIDHLLLGQGRVPAWPFAFEAYWSVYRPELTFVAEMNGRIEGFLVGYIKEEEGNHSIMKRADAQVAPPSHQQKVGWIEMTGVHPRSQHKGIGRMLTEAFDEECRRNHAMVNCVVPQKDGRLAKFYSGLGFKKWDAVIYTKQD
jgi:ribosomal protein S18 acetylase RimI-like enzyme